MRKTKWQKSKWLLWEPGDQSGGIKEAGDVYVRSSGHAGPCEVHVFTLSCNSVIAKK